jgi:aspartyl-tRNA(Asn)/glutamyl-tRNA(Gln) amidotransferase subunit C
MTISREEVLTLASLARLEVAPESVDVLAAELSRFLDYVKKLDELDTSDVPPTTQVAAASAPLRPDVLAPGLTKSAALAQAPRADEVGFLVPGFVDES